MKVRDLLYRSLRLIGVLASGETPDAATAQDTLTSMNSLIDSIKNTGFMAYENQVLTLPLIPSQQSYTIGTGGDFNYTRPNAINNASFVLNNLEYPIEIINADQWAEIYNKDLNTGIPCKLYFNPSYPLGTINIWPKPSSSGNLKLYDPKPIEKFSSINDDVLLPPGYETFLVFGTADLIGGEFGKELTPRQLKILNDSKADIMRKNTEPVIMECDPTGASSCEGDFDFTTGGYRR